MNEYRPLITHMELLNVTKNGWLVRLIESNCK